MISVIIPAFNEIGSLPELMDQLRKALHIYKKWEILFVDDGSTDGSTEFLNDLSRKDENVTLIQFHRNYGKSAALAEGFKRAKGEFLITMDADLQDDPAEIPNLMKKLEEGFDLVSGWKKKRKDPISKRFPSKIFNYVTRIMTGVKIHDFNCGLKIYRKEVIKTLDLYGGRHRYIPALAGHNKFRISEIQVNHRPRMHGVTKYGGSRLFHGFFDLISIIFMNRYTQQPLHLFGFFGLFCGLASLTVELYVIGRKIFFGHSFYEHLALMLFGAMLFILGLWFFSIGLIAEMITRGAQEKESRVKQII
ncbi:MAG: glycosyltransferase [Candidatus Marinimicrobia bacterium]|jgi:glycosyltransferase involved in cell wall biosynthesis|nr:glycosyltransferase [Candidatus Neomarinimicrobiota bacterium]